MRVTRTLKQPRGGPVWDLLGQDLAARKLAFKVAIGKSARGLEKDIETGLRSAGLPRLAPLMASAVYPNREGAGSLNAQAIVYVKAGPVYQAAVQLALEGGMIRAAGGRHLPIPTPHNLVGTGGRRVMYTARMMAESGASFVMRRRTGPGLVWMLRVAAQTARGRRGRPRQAVVSPVLFARARGTGAVRALPMFTLVPQLTLRARLNVRGMIERRFGEVQSRYDDEYRRIIGG